jgi:hypothetical protein
MFFGLTSSDNVVPKIALDKFDVDEGGERLGGVDGPGKDQKWSAWPALSEVAAMLCFSK